LGSASPVPRDVVVERGGTSPERIRKARLQPPLVAKYWWRAGQAAYCSPQVSTEP